MIRRQEVFLTEGRSYPHLLLHRSAGPALPQPVDNLLRNVETLVQRHSCLRSLTSWAKCLRNAPCQCNAHATARADIRHFKSENSSRAGTFSLNKHEIQVRSKKPEGYQLR